MSERAHADGRPLDWPPCRLTPCCLRPDAHDGDCQPANRTEQRRVKELMQRG